MGKLKRLFVACTVATVLVCILILLGCGAPDLVRTVRLDQEESCIKGALEQEPTESNVQAVVKRCDSVAFYASSNKPLPFPTMRDSYDLNRETAYLRNYADKAVTPQTESAKFFVDDPERPYPGLNLFCTRGPDYFELRENRNKQVIA